MAFQVEAAEEERQASLRSTAVSPAQAEATAFLVLLSVAAPRLAAARVVKTLVMGLRPSGLSFGSAPVARLTERVAVLRPLNATAPRDTVTNGT